jgi:hypothetical protein
LTRERYSCPGDASTRGQTAIPGPTPRRAFDMGKADLETMELGATRWLEEYRLE